MSRTKKYSVLTYNIGKYELFYDLSPNVMNDEIEYIYVTDDHSIMSDTWNIVYEDNLVGDVFDKVYQIKFNPFKYIHTDVVLTIDARIEILKDVMPMFEMFDKYGYDAAVVPHFLFGDINSEYDNWVNNRNYPIEEKEKCINFIKSLGYDLNYKGLYEGGISIKRNNSFCKSWCAMTYGFLKFLATPPSTIERNDQVICSVVLNKYFNDKNIMPISPYIYARHDADDTYFKLHIRGDYGYCFALSEYPLYLFNKLIIFS